MNNVKDQIKTQLVIKRLNNKSKFNFKKSSEALGMSRQTFRNKLIKLKDKKIIKNFTININPNIYPNNLKYVFFEIKTNPKEPELVGKLLKIPQLRILDGILGEFSLFALFVFKSLEEYYNVLNIIDKIMAHSYFKKYQIIEPIKVFKINGIQLNEIKNENKIDLDGDDDLILKILQEMQELRPISTYEIKEILKNKFKKEISQPTIHQKIKNFEKSGVILNYTINFCPKKIGIKGKYILRIKPKDPSKYDYLARKLIKKNEIVDLFRIGEQYGLFAIVRVKRIEDYGKFIKDLYISEEIEDTYSNFVLDELKLYSNFIIY